MLQKIKLIAVTLPGLLFFTLPSFAQTQLLLRPYVGIGTGFCRFTIKPDNSDWFGLTQYENTKYNGYSTLNPLHNIQAGLLLQIKMENKHYSLLTGFTTGIASYGYNIYLGTQTDTLSGSPINQKVYDGDSRALTLIQVPLYIEFPIFSSHKKVTDSINGKSYSADYRPVLSFIGGVTFNYALTRPRALPTVSDSGRKFNSNDTIMFKEYCNYRSRFGMAICAGLSWTIYGKEKTREFMSLTLMFEQGVSDIANADLYVYRNNQVWHRQLSTRGSEVQLNVSVPLYLSHKQDVGE